MSKRKVPYDFEEIKEYNDNLYVPGKYLKKSPYFFNQKRPNDFGYWLIYTGAILGTPFLFIWFYILYYLITYLFLGRFEFGALVGVLIVGMFASICVLNVWVGYKMIKDPKRKKRRSNHRFKRRSNKN